VRRRVAITGLGVVSALGGDAAATWAGLVDGRVGIGPLTLFDAADERTGTAAEIRDPGPAPALSRADRRRLSRGELFALRAALEAVGDAGLGPGDLAEAGLLVGGGGGALLGAEDYVATRLRARPGHPSRVMGFFPGILTDRLAQILGCRGAVDTLLTACSSSTIAIGLAAARVAAGAERIVVTGGAESLSRTTYGGFNALRLVDPEPCRPFDRSRRGMSLGEGAAFLVLEDDAHARRRGARIYAEVAGLGMTADGGHMTAPDPLGDGILRAARAALRDAGIGAEAVDHVNAHGTATEQNDRSEACALRALLGDRCDDVPVVSIKGMVGHCLGAAGAIEAFATAMTLHTGIVPPTAGLSDPDPQCRLRFVRGRGQALAPCIALSTSLGFGGNNGALVLRRARS